MFGIPVAWEMVSGVKVKFTPARFTWPSRKCRKNKRTNSGWCWIWDIISQYRKHECCWKHVIASGQACNWAKEVGSSLTCLPLLWDLLGTFSSVVESLSCSYPCSYDEFVSDMMLRTRCLTSMCWYMYGENKSLFFKTKCATYVIRGYKEISQWIQ